MRYLATVCALAFILAAPALAQDSPKAEIFGGYNYMRFNPGLVNEPAIGLNGIRVSAAYYIEPKIGVVADLTFNHNGNANNSGTSFNTSTYMFGPRYAYRADRVTPFAQVLIGGAHASASQGGVTVSWNAFAMALGGGLDLKATDKISIRPFQFEYLMTRFKSTDFATTQNNVRISAGVVFNF
jgi:opacity protein-like surface antigen